MTRLSQPMAQQPCDRRPSSCASSSGVDHLARHVHALVDLDAPLARDQRLEGAGHAVGPGPRAPAELEGVAEAARGDRARPWRPCARARRWWWWWCRG